MNLFLIPIALLAAAIDYQVKNPQSISDKKKITADTITRWSARKNGEMVIATADDAFPGYDKTTERIEVINIGKNLVGDNVFLATVQDSDFVLDDVNAEYEARCFDAILPDAGSHFGTAAHVDGTLKTTGFLYVLDNEGKLKERLKVKIKKAFLAGEFDGKVQVAVETDDRFGILDAMTLVDRARNDATLLLDSEGRAKQDGEMLIRAELDEMMAVMAVKNGKVAYYDQDGNKLEKENEATPDNVLDFPGVNARGKQNVAARVKVTKTGDTTGTIQRLAANG